jgi:hypothetical protein
MRRIFVPVIVLQAALISSLACAGGRGGFTDPKEAAEKDPDFPVQGEYSGQVRTDAGEQKMGVQVIARGGGKFHAVFYPGGLPGEGWEKPKGKTKSGGETNEQKITVFTGKPWRARVEKGTMTVLTAGDKEAGALKRVERKSPTLGMKPPEGAVVLFDGTGTDAFARGRMSKHKLLMEGATSKRKFRDFRLHIEFRTPYKPRAGGQGRGNSGCYLQKRYEIQILDSFGLEGKSNECGGVYKVKAPDVNMCLPPLSWQTYDVDFRAARFDEKGKKTKNAVATIRHNGFVIHKDLEIPRSTGGGIRESADPGPLYLQGHGNPVRFRNIWILERKEERVEEEKQP